MVASLGGPALSAGMLVAGKYRLVKQLGEGAMGVVWSAVNSATNGEVALKLILRSEPELRHRLLREAQACGTIRHRNVVQVHDVGQTTTGDPFLVMELLHGETLADLLARKRRLPPQEAASIGRDVARALAAAHDKGIVHRDLKPANIFLHNEPGSEAPVVKVLDFGVSKNFLHSDGLRTVAGGAVGSPMYMSPEQARAERELDGRADVWSLGVVLYEMLTGERPFTGETTEVIARITSGDIPLVSRRIRRIDPDFDAIVAGCLTRDRDTRLGPPIEVARRLDAHAAPEARAPLPSMMEIGPSELGGGGASPSGGALLSPGSGPLSLQPASSAGFGRAPAPGVGPTALEPARSPGFGVTGLRPSSSGHGATALASDDASEDEATRRIDPSMMTPRMPPRGPTSIDTGAPSSSAYDLEPGPPGTGTVPMIEAHAGVGPASIGVGPKGTVRMDPAIVAQAEAQAHARARMDAQAPPQATSFSAFTEGPHIPALDPAAAHHGKPSSSKRILFAILCVLLVGAAAVLAAVRLRSAPATPSTDIAPPTAEVSAQPGSPVPPSAPAPVPDPSPAAPAPTPDAPTASASSTAAADVPPLKTAAPTSKPTSRPQASTKPAPAPSCTSRFGVGCKPAATSSATDPRGAKKPKSKPVAFPDGL